MDVADRQMIGMVGTLSGPCTPTSLGEVTFPLRGGSELFHAYSSDPDQTISMGTHVVVVEYHPPRTVVVTPV